MKHQAYAVHFVYIGIFLLLVGLQLNAVESFILTPNATRMLSENFGPPVDTAEGAVNHFMVNTTNVRKTMTFPAWLGWAILSTGVVLTFHGTSQIVQKRLKK